VTEHLLMGVRWDPGRDEAEAEPILVHVAGSYAVLTLDDGTVLNVDRLELLSALREPLRDVA
jgi:enoyl-CoA hydratase/carnithine racemase